MSNKIRIEDRGSKGIVIQNRDHQSPASVRVRTMHAVGNYRLVLEPGAEVRFEYTSTQRLHITPE